MLSLEIASILPSHRGHSHGLHESHCFVSIIVHEEVVDPVEVVHLLDEHDECLLFETRSFRSTFEYFFCLYRLGIRVFESHYFEFLLDS